MSIHCSLAIFVSGSVMPDHRPTKSVLAPSMVIEAVGTPNERAKQAARSPSVKPPGLCIPGITPGVWWVSTSGEGFGIEVASSSSAPQSSM
ncbi:uncharacterized protein METZ01_LOCUS163610, partial [marine metagenome]